MPKCGAFGRHGIIQLDFTPCGARSLAQGDRPVTFSWWGNSTLRPT